MQWPLAPSHFQPTPPTLTQGHPMAWGRRRRLALGVAALLCVVCCFLPTSVAAGGFFQQEEMEESKEEKETEDPSMTTLEYIRDNLEDLHEDIQESVQGVKDRAARARKRALDLHERLTDVVDDAVDDVREYLGLEKPVLERVEDRLELALQKTDFARRVIMKGGVGLGMVFFGLHFSHLVVFIHTLRVSGLPVIQRAWREFLEMYAVARQTIKKEYPNMAQTKKLLQAVHFEIRSTRKILQEAAEAAKDGTVTKAEAREAVRKAKVNLRELNEKSWLLNQAFSSMHAVAAAIDVRKIKDLAGGIYTSALACFATASSSTLRGLSIGFDLASLISRHIDHAFGAIAERMHRLEVFRILPKETQKLLGLTVSLVSVVKGLLVVHFVVPRLTLAVSSSALGALWVTDMLVDVTDAGAGGAGKGPMHDKGLFLLSNLFWTAAGCIFQTKRAGDEMPRLFQILLHPALRLEKFLRSVDQVLGSSRDKIQELITKRKPSKLSEGVGIAAGGVTVGATAAVVLEAAGAGAELDGAEGRRRRGGFLGVFPRFWQKPPQRQE